jgi:uncharacterized protein YjiS (DUF1127 family)
MTSITLPIAFSAIRLLRQLIAGASAWSARRELETWPDDCLKDIGLSRGEISFATAHGRAATQQGGSPDNGGPADAIR